MTACAKSHGNLRLGAGNGNGAAPLCVGGQPPLAGPAAMSGPSEFTASDVSGTAQYRDGVWYVQWGTRSESHRLLRIALAHALGVGPASVSGLAAKILTSRSRDEADTRVASRPNQGITG